MMDSYTLFLKKSVKIISAMDVAETTAFKTLVEIPQKNVIEIEFSPKSGFLCCWERWGKYYLERESTYTAFRRLKLIIMCQSQNS